jgi:Cdc6-like AAA superfamily ATPase
MPDQLGYQGSTMAPRLVRPDGEAMVTIINERGLRAAREFRKAIAARDEDRDLREAIDVYDRAVTPAERQAAASYLLQHATRADTRYREAVSLALMRCLAPELLPEDE